MVNLLRIKVSPGHTSVSVCFIPELSDASHTCKYFTYSSINATKTPIYKNNLTPVISPIKIEQYPASLLFPQKVLRVNCNRNTYTLRDRPYNLKGGGLWFFVSFRNFFSDNTSQNIFFCRSKREFFFHNSTLGYMTKTRNQIFFFFLHQNQNIFFSNIGNQNIFLEKKTITPPPPLQVKWSFPYIHCLPLEQKSDFSF